MARSVVVDKNFVRRPERLEAFLSSDPENRAVLTDYLAVECFAGYSLINLTRSMASLAKFPRQIFVLKSSRELAALGPIDPNLRFDMIDWRLTNSFADFCSQVHGVEAGNDERKEYFARRAAAAQRKLDSIAAAAPKLVHFMQVLKADTGAELLKVRRTDASLPRADGARLIATIEHLARRMLSDDERIPPIPEDPLLASRCYIFRAAIAIRLLALWWAANGGIESATVKTVRNDWVDITYCAVATYWDGLETADERAAEIYSETEFLANHFFPRCK